MIQLRHYIEYLDEIIGFFVVEDVIMQTEPTLVTAAHRDQLWEMALKKIIHVMETGFVSLLTRFLKDISSFLSLYTSL